MQLQKYLGTIFRDGGNRKPIKIITPSSIIYFLFNKIDVKFTPYQNTRNQFAAVYFLGPRSLQPTPILSNKNWSFAKLLSSFLCQFLLWEKIWENWEIFITKSQPHCKCLQGITGTLQGKCTISMQKVCKKPYTPQRERFRILWRNPVIFTDCGEIL